MFKNPKLKTAKDLMLMLFYLWVFLLSIKILGDTLKMFFKADAQDLIQNATNDPIVGLMIGLLATAIIQSSSSTTSIIIAFVGAGTLTFTSAIPMIMGANIGTSVTGILVSLGNIRNRVDFQRSFSAAIVHDFFNWFCVFLFLPLEIFTGFIGKSAKALTDFFIGASSVHFESPINKIIDPVGDFMIKFFAGWFDAVTEGKINMTTGLMIFLSILALILLFISLAKMSIVMKEMLIGKFEKIIHKYVFNNQAMAFLFGLLFTISVQSSSVTISVIVPLVGAGILTLEQIFPYAVGANIGTTITGILAALVTGNPLSISVAFVHTLFNTFGAIVFIPLKFLPIRSARWFSSKSAENRTFVFIFLIGAFFVLPILFIWLYK